MPVGRRLVVRRRIQDDSDTRFPTEGVFAILNEIPETILKNPEFQRGFFRKHHRRCPASRSLKDKTPTDVQITSALRLDGMELQYLTEEQRTPERCLMAVKSNGLALRYVTNQTLEHCLHAVHNNGRALEFVKDKQQTVCMLALYDEAGALAFFPEELKTREVCLSVVKEHAASIVHTPFRDEEFLMEVLEEEPVLIRHLEPQYITEDIAMKAVSRWGYVLKHIPNPSPTVCLAAVMSDGEALQYVKDQTYDICKAAVENDPSAIQYVKEQTEDICEIALQECGSFLEYIKNQTPELCLKACQMTGSAIQFAKYKTPEVCEAAVRRDGLALAYIVKKTPELIRLALEEDGRALKWVRNQTAELCQMAVEQSPHALYYVQPSFQTEELCLNALRSNRHAWHSFWDEGCILAKLVIQTPEICELAVRLDPENILHVKSEFLTETLLQVALESEGRLITRMKVTTVQMWKWALTNYAKLIQQLPINHKDRKELFEYALGRNGSCLQFLKHAERTRELCLIAVGAKEGGYSVWDLIPKELKSDEELQLQFVTSFPYQFWRLKSRLTERVCLVALANNGMGLRHVTKQTPEICLAAVRNRGKALQYVNRQTPEICWEAVKADGRALKFVEVEKTLELCCLAVDQNRKAWKYVTMPLPEREPPLLVLKQDTEVFQAIVRAIPEAPPDILEQEWEDPISMELVEPGVYAFWKFKETWFLVGSLELLSKFTREHYKKSTADAVFDLMRNMLVPVETLRWFKMP
jgi:hypothetical protein